MKEIPCIIIVGKPGAGKSSIGNELAQILKGKYMSLGSFMRETLNMPDPHIGIDKKIIYEKLYSHLILDNENETLVLDCHPYPEDDLMALQSFVQKPRLQLQSIIHIDADDTVALKRLEQRPRPGQTYTERLEYFNTHKHLIDTLMEHPASVRIENNVDFDTKDSIKNLAREILKKLENPKL